MTAVLTVLLCWPVVITEVQLRIKLPYDPQWPGYITNVSNFFQINVTSIWNIQLARYIKNSDLLCLLLTIKSQESSNFATPYLHPLYYTLEYKKNICYKKILSYLLKIYLKLTYGRRRIHLCDTHVSMIPWSLDSSNILIMIIYMPLDSRFTCN